MEISIHHSSFFTFCAPAWIIHELQTLRGDLLCESPTGLVPQRCPCCCAGSSTAPSLSALTQTILRLSLDMLEAFLPWVQSPPQPTECLSKECVSSMSLPFNLLLCKTLSFPVSPLAPSQTPPPPFLHPSMSLPMLPSVACP